jgi:carboxylesterase type B
MNFYKFKNFKLKKTFLRFRDPVAPENWTEPLDCTQEGPRFPQIDFTWEPPFAPFRGDLDSMHINVFTKNLNPSVKYPVMGTIKNI